MKLAIDNRSVLLYARSMMKKIFEFKNKKPYAATLTEWRKWKQSVSSTEPIKYWLLEIIPDWINDRWRDLTKPYNDLRYAIRCRIFDRYHVIQTGLPPGYADCDTRMLYGMFNLLVDFIEVEKAWMNVICNKDKYKDKHPWWSLGWTRFKSFRDIDSGLEYLAWEMTLDNVNLAEHERCESQAQTAREQLALYTWWKEIRPARLDPMDASGWSEYCEKLRNKSPPVDILDGYRTPEEELESRAALDKLHAIEQAYDDEDTKKLIRLIKIRKSLWT